MKFLNAKKAKKLALNSSHLRDRIVNGINVAVEKGAKTFELPDIALYDFIEADAIIEELRSLDYFVVVTPLSNESKITDNLKLVQKHYQVIIAWDTLTKENYCNSQIQPQPKVPTIVPTENEVEEENSVKVNKPTKIVSSKSKKISEKEMK